MSALPKAPQHGAARVAELRLDGITFILRAQTQSRNHPHDWSWRLNGAPYEAASPSIPRHGCADTLKEAMADLCEHAVLVYPDSAFAKKYAKNAEAAESSDGATAADEGVAASEQPGDGSVASPGDLFPVERPADEPEREGYEVEDLQGIQRRIKALVAEHMPEVGPELLDRLRIEFVGMPGSGQGYRRPVVDTPQPTDPKGLRTIATMPQGEFGPEDVVFSADWTPERVDELLHRVDDGEILPDDEPLEGP